MRYRFAGRPFVGVNALALLGVNYAPGKGGGRTSARNDRSIALRDSR
jgi:hypothetical protein